ncbi:MAG: hypothetical protein LUQ38_04345 [Methanotrichaceae archaeon]|nr:hypothetical protein [Methanotrichaceae archaeon]MDD1758477.1 hypothetical protein [Methanotrichaceae archaeon]
MPDSNNLTMRIQEMLLRLGDEKTFSELENTLRVLDEQERMLNDTLEELLHEVDELLVRIDTLEEAEEAELRDGAIYLR